MQQWVDQQHGEHYALGGYAAAVEARLAAWETSAFGQRIWAKDGTLWIPDPEAAAADPDLENRLGWLDAPEMMLAQVPALAAFADEIRDAWFHDAVVLGMGGSSLAPEVYAQVFGPAEGYLPLHVLDSTHPEAILRLAGKLKPVHTLFLVSSKSGGTLETLSFFNYFLEQVRELENNAGRNFAAITDPGSGLERLARERGLREVFPGPPDVGGRYSALTNFGLVPAALLGIPLVELLGRAAAMSHRCGPEIPAAKNPGLRLGAALGELGLAGRDKVTLCLSPTLAPFALWAEQLIAESTGKAGLGLVPVPEPYLGAPETYGPDRVFVALLLDGDDNGQLARGLEALEAAGQPVIRLTARDKLDLGAEFFRWEFATAAAGAVLGINPFNQPDVQAAKTAAHRLMQAYEASGALPSQTPTLCEEGVEVYEVSGGSLVAACDHFLGQVGQGDYVAIMAYLAPALETDAALDEIRTLLRDALRKAVTVGYGPRFLHSTGQLHKGGSNHGLFLQITQSEGPDVEVPREKYTFGTVIAAQAQGDLEALKERDRRVMRVNLTGDVATGLARLRQALAAALAQA